MIHFYEYKKLQGVGHRNFKSRQHGGQTYFKKKARSSNRSNKNRANISSEYGFLCFHDPDVTARVEKC